MIVEDTNYCVYSIGLIRREAQLEIAIGKGSCGPRGEFAGAE